jgi:hypothetical protein
MRGLRLLLPQIFQNCAHLRHFGLVGKVPPRLPKRTRIPLAHRGELQQARGVGAAGRIEFEPVGLDAKCDRRKERVDCRIGRAGEERTAELAQTVIPQDAIRSTSRASALGILLSRTRTPQFIEQQLRNSLNPECISAAALRAQARALESAGHTMRCRSARYSAIARESHTAHSPSTRHGTLPLEEILPKPLQLEAAPKGIRCSWKASPSSRISPQARRDQEE